MFAFSARAEHENNVAGGVHWVAVYGKLTDVLHSFARVVEKFREGNMRRRAKKCECRRGVVKAALAQKKER